MTRTIDIDNIGDNGTIEVTAEDGYIHLSEHGHMTIAETAELIAALSAAIAEATRA